MKWLIHWLIPFSVTVAGHGVIHEQIRTVKQQLETTPDNLQLAIKLARLQLEDGQIPVSLRTLNRILATNSDMREARYYLAMALYRQKSHQQALKEINTFLSGITTEKGAKVRGYRLKAHILTALQQHLKASEAYAQVVFHAREKQPDYYLEWAQSLISANRPEEAIKRLQQGVIELNHLWVLEQGVIDLALSQNLYPLALKHNRCLLNQGHNPVSLYTQQGKIHLRQGKTKLAGVSFSKALEAINNLPAARQQTVAMLAMKKELKALIRER